MAVLLAIGLASCAGPGGPNSVTQDIKASQGGVITHPNGATLTIPAGGLAADATVTLTDTGRPKHVKDDPLSPVSDAFSVQTKDASGKPVALTKPATLSMTTDKNAAQNAAGLIVAELDPSVAHVVKLHLPLAATGSATTGSAATESATAANASVSRSGWARVGAAGAATATDACASACSAKYSELGSQLWVLRLAPMPQQAFLSPQASSARHGLMAPTNPQDTGSVLDVPWYWQAGTQWCADTADTMMAHYFSINENVGDLNYFFGPTTALASWQVAARNHQPYTQSTGIGVLQYVGVPLIDPTSSSGPGYEIFSWDDDFVSTLDSSQGGFNDFQAYVTQILQPPPGAGDRRPLNLLVDAQDHAVTVVGADANDIYLHDSSGAITGKEPSIATPLTWTNFQQNVGKVWKNNQETHRIWTGVLSGYPAKPDRDRTGSIVFGPGDVWFTDPGGYNMNLRWDGADPHTYGYYFEDESPGLNAVTSNHTDLGTPPDLWSPVHYQFRIVNDTSTVQSYSGVVHLVSGLAPQQTYNVTVPAYSQSDLIKGMLDKGAPRSNVGPGDDTVVVELSEQGGSKDQDAKFFHFTTITYQPPTISITSPSNGAQAYANTQVPFVATAREPFTFADLSGEIHWSYQQGGPLTPFGQGATATATFGQLGPVTITASVTNADGSSSSATETIAVVQAPVGQPAFVHIDSPADGTTYNLNFPTLACKAGSCTVTLVGSGSAGMALNWSDSIEGFLGGGPTITAHLTYANVNCGAATTHVVTLSGYDNQGRSATASIHITIIPTCLQ
jgi:hypothetical protein